jgi:hypothetical protein
MAAADLSAEINDATPNAVYLQVVHSQQLAALLPAWVPHCCVRRCQHALTGAMACPVRCGCRTFPRRLPLSWQSLRCCCCWMCAGRWRSSATSKWWGWACGSDRWPCVKPYACMDIWLGVCVLSKCWCCLIGVLMPVCGCALFLVGLSETERRLAPLLLLLRVMLCLCCHDQQQPSTTTSQPQALI